MKTQVNLSTIQETLLITRMARVKEQKLAESVVIDPKELKETSTPLYTFLGKGVLMYLSEQHVKQLFDKLIENNYDSLFVFDCLSPLMLKNQQRHD